jgi:hypothetical protein
MAEILAPGLRRGAYGFLLLQEIPLIYLRPVQRMHTLLYCGSSRCIDGIGTAPSFTVLYAVYHILHASYFFPVVFFTFVYQYASQQYNILCPPLA